MGLPKWDHIKTISQMEPVSEAWENAHGNRPTDADVDRVYEKFLPLQVETVARYSEMIPGVLEVIAAMRARGLKIGSTTGYPREVMEVVVREAKAQGYEPDSIVTADDTPLGRPSPFPAFKTLSEMGGLPGGGGGQDR